MGTKKATPAAEKTAVKKTTEKAAAAKTTKTTKTTTKKAAVTEADIRAKAEEIYQARVAAGTEGTPEGDWIAAENALNVKK
jgi:hypothetical protein